RVLILDCEGIDDPEQDYRWAVKLFILCLVISSTFVYNINGIVERDDIGRLFLMSDLSKYISPPNDTKYLPHLVVLLRDFHLIAPDDFRTHFLNQLDAVNRECESLMGSGWWSEEKWWVESASGLQVC